MPYLHQDIVLDIIVRLPVKPILRFRCVSKAWCKLLKDPDFVKKHLNHANEMNRFSVMLLSGKVEPGFDYRYIKDTYTLAYDPSLFTLDTIFQFPRQLALLQFVKNDEVLLGYPTDVDYHLDLYDIKLGTSTNLKSYAKQDSYFATTFVYVESLVPLS
ncbi:hypothetical protein MKX03_020681, partial [Papaver bracteatum]